MTVLETIRKYGLEDFRKSYKNACGKARNCSYPLDRLCGMRVEGIQINFSTKEACITLTVVD